MRALISTTLTLLNVITRRGLRSCNRPQTHPTAILKSTRIDSTGDGFRPEGLIKRLRVAKTHLEGPMDLAKRRRGDNNAFRLKSVNDIARALRRPWALEWTAESERPAMRVTRR